MYLNSFQALRLLMSRPDNFLSRRSVGLLQAFCAGFQMRRQIVIADESYVGQDGAFSVVSHWMLNRIFESRADLVGSHSAAAVMNLIAGGESEAFDLYTKEFLAWLSRHDLPVGHPPRLRTEVFVLCDALLPVSKHRQAYLVGGSLAELESFLDGVALGVSSLGQPVKVVSCFDEIEREVNRRNGFRGAFGWSNVLRYEAELDESRALDLFFDAFRQLGPRSNQRVGA